MSKSELGTTLKIFSIITLVIGALAIVSTILYPDIDSGSAFVGGALFVTQGWLALAFISKK